MSPFIDYQHSYMLIVSSTLSGLSVPLHTQGEFEILTHWASFKGNNKKNQRVYFSKSRQTQN